MGWSKRDLVRKAFGALGLASYDFDLSPDQLQDGLSSLDAMIASWSTRGIRLGYPSPSTPNGGSLDDDSNLPDSANRAVFLNLALELAPSVGREVSPRIAAEAKMAYNGLLSLHSVPVPMRLPNTLPAGAGLKRWRGINRPFIENEDDSIEAGPDSELEFKG